MGDAGSMQQQLQAALRARYRLIRELGRGGMGIVFLAEDLKHGRPVALKVLRPELAQSLGADRFLREIRISARLNHPNILTLIDSGAAGGFMYYVLPYVEGESLHARLAREEQLPLDEAIRIAREVADALAYAHAAGVVHRDIKPENILFEAGHAVVTDFGIARAVSEAGGDRLTDSGIAVGTPAYMSPEQALGSEKLDPRADIYSLACVLYEMLAGAPPYGGPTPHAIIARKAVDPVPGLRVVRETVPPGVEAAIVRALAKSPVDRFATAREFADALTAPAPPAPFLVPRSRAFVTASVIVVVAAAAYILLALTRGGGSTGVAATFARLTADAGVEWFPSLSPDGEWLVYAGEASGNRDIYLQRVDGQHAINLTADAPGDDDQPAFSPDGSRIAFRSARDGGGLFVMGRTGEAVRRVTRRGFKPAWNPDGRSIVFATENVEFNPQNSESRGELWVADVETGATRRLDVGDASLPSWSPHGHRIAFFHRLGAAAQGHIWTVAATEPAGPATAVTSGLSRDWNPTWSPDGRYIYFVSNRGGSMNLWRVRVDEASGRALAEPEQVTTPATSLAHISLSADGRRIAYSSILVTTNVQRAAFDPARGVLAGQPEWVTRGSRRWANPAPSPDGRALVFYSLAEPEGDFYVMRSDGVGAPRQVTGDSASDRVPRWSPDGGWIAMFSDRSGPLQIWKIRPDGSGLTQLTDLQGNTAFPVWSPDGRRMAAATVRTTAQAAFLFDPNRPWTEQQPVYLPPVADSLAPFAPHDWSPDGRRLAGMISALDRGIIVYDFERRAYDRLTPFGQWPVWLPDSRRILFVTGGNAFHVVDARTRAARKVFEVARDVIGPPQLTPDGRALYFTRRVTEADIWLATLK